jgi:hemoglobin
MYPEDDLGPAEDRLRMFLEQYWGGPTTYSDERGHPRLRMRHAPYVVDHDARERWLAAMTHAVNVTLPKFEVDEELTVELRTYFANAALGMVNS